MVVNFNKFDYFDTTIQYNSDYNIDYIVIQSGDTLNSLISSLSNDNGTWDILDSDYGEVADKDITITNGSKYVLDFKSNKPYIKSNSCAIYIFDHNPTSQDFDLISSN